MTESILVVNAGSSSIKFALFDAASTQPAAACLRGEIAGLGSRPRFRARDGAGAPLPGLPREEAIAGTHEDALAAVLDWLHDHAPASSRIVAAGHRIVHGGERFAEAVRIDANVIAELEALVPLARLHQPFGLAAVRTLQARAPDLPQVACFDTSFHRTLPEVAARYALPRQLTASGIRRYGFHGLSYAYLASELAQRMDDFGRSRVIGAHLGSGSSLCAMLGGRSIATTMGFTPLEGLVMGTRPGNVDPGILLYLLQERGMSVQALEHMLYHESGLFGLSGATADMKSLLESSCPAAREAVASYVYAIVRDIGALAACLGGVDGLVFTAGIGERSASIRARVCERLDWLGVRLDSQANRAHAPRIDAADSRVRVDVIPTDEEGVIARDTIRLLGASR